MNRDDIMMLLRAVDHFTSALINSGPLLTTRMPSLMHATENLKATRHKLVDQLGTISRREESAAVNFVKPG